MDKCKYCDSEAEFKVLVEDDENPIRTQLEDLCSEHMANPPSAVIESWTKSEWLSEE